MGVETCGVAACGVRPDCRLGLRRGVSLHDPLRELQLRESGDAGRRPRIHRLRRGGVGDVRLRCVPDFSCLRAFQRLAATAVRDRARGPASGDRGGSTGRHHPRGDSGRGPGVSGARAGSERGHRPNGCRPCLGPHAFPDTLSHTGQGPDSIHRGRWLGRARHRSPRRTRGDGRSRLQHAAGTRNGVHHRAEALRSRARHRDHDRGCHPGYGGRPAEPLG